MADFGLARIDGAERLTRTGAVTGTPLYMAPEQMIGDRKAVGPCSDVWALGVILYETLCKSHPFPGLSYVELIELTKSAPTPPSSVNPGVPRELSNACMRALNPKPKKRYANAAEFAGALDQWLAQTEEPPVGVGALVAGAALLVLGGLAVGLLPRFVDAPTPPPPAKTSPVDGQPVDPEPTATLPIEPLAIDLVARRTGIQRGLEQLESDDLRGLQRTLEQLELPPDLPGMSDHGAELANLLLVHLRDRALGGGEWDDSSELLLRSLAKAGLRPTDRRAGDALLDHLWAEWHALKRVETETFESALICLVRLDIDPQEEHLLTLSRLDTEAYRKNRDPLIRALSRLREFFGANPGSEQRLAMAELLDAQNTKFGPRFRSRCWAAARGGKGSAEVRLSRLRRARELAPRSPWPRIPLARALLQLGRPQEAALEAVQAFVLFEGGGYPDRIIVVGGSGFRMKAKGVEVLLEAGALREAKASLATIKTRNSRERKKLEALRTRVSEGSR